MATDKAENGTVRTADLFDTEEKQWVKVSVADKIKSIERVMAKYPAGSGAYVAHGKDVDKLRAIMAKV